MPSINLDQPLARGIDPLNLLRVAAPKGDSQRAFDDHFQRLAPQPSRDNQPQALDVKPPQPEPQVARTSALQKGPPETTVKDKQQEHAQNDDRPANETAQAPAPPAHAETSPQTGGDQPTHATTDQPKPDKPAAASARATKASKAAAKLNSVATTKPTVKNETATAGREKLEAASSAAVAQTEQSAAATPGASSAPVEPLGLDVEVYLEASNQADREVKKYEVVAGTIDNPVSAAASASNEPAPAEIEQKVTYAAQKETDLEVTVTPTAHRSDGKSAATITDGKKKNSSATAPTEQLDAALVAADPLAAQATTATDGSSTEQQSRPTTEPADKSTIQRGSAANPAPATPADGSVPAGASLAAAPERQSTTLAGGTRMALRGTSATGAGDVERVRFAQRVSRALQTAGEGNGSLRLRLSPPELGSVRIEVTVKDGTMSARLEAETPAARAALLESCPDLRSRLAEHDITLDHFEVELNERAGSDEPHDGAAGNAYADRGSQPPQPRGKLRATTVAPDTVATKTTERIIAADKLNVVI